ncbi:TraV family lipoprotein [Woeseia oceani]|uniref:Type IV conjugative transfer system protein TraV n=1 Tax=Woeseia oceani TaxID=1548547 RepID=A0A193LC67_9GAMM|nr:TraV family lipoprotein [Woeseia oceani]ANO50026.1 hypothetical protein BA177_01235 [Woeseia oceani]
MQRLKTTGAAWLMAALLSGCGTLPDTTLGHKCGIPDGVGCLSTQEVYNRTVAGDLPGLQTIEGAPTRGRDTELPIATDDAPTVIRTRAMYAPPEELRIWVNQWRDVDGDLHDDAFIYVVVGEGQWLVRD